MKNPAEILIDGIGHDVLKQKFGMTDRNLRHVRSVGSFAAQWYRPIKDEAESRGIHCPLDAFNFKDFTNKRLGGSAPAQGKENLTSGGAT